MYLLDGRQEPVADISKPGYWPQAPGRFAQPVEQDALAPIERYAKLFDYQEQFDILSYSPRSSKPATARDESLRAIGAATLRERGSRELLDGLSRNLLFDLLKLDVHRSEPYYSRQPPSFALLGDSRNLLGLRGRYEPGSIKEMLRTVSSPSEWEGLQSFEGGRQKRKDYSAQILGRRMVLRFTGKVRLDGYRDPGSGFAPVYSLSSIELLVGGRDLRIEEVRSGLIEIIADFDRRTELSAAYKQAPEAIGMPPELRAEIKRRLAKVGIEPESYSRVGFSSGPFPGSSTRLRVTGTVMDLIFRRCSHCGDVKSLGLDDPEEYSQAPELNALSNTVIGPWHGTICTYRRY